MIFANGRETLFYVVYISIMVFVFSYASYHGGYRAGRQVEYKAQTEIQQECLGGREAWGACTRLCLQVINECKEYVEIIEELEL